MAKTISKLEPTIVEEEKKTEKPVKSLKKSVKKGVVVDCGLLNIRAESNLASSILKTIPVGTEVEILGSENEFYKIAEGFVMKAYIAI